MVTPFPTIAVDRSLFGVRHPAQYNVLGSGENMQSARINLMLEARGKYYLPYTGNKSLSEVGILAASSC